MLYTVFVPFMIFVTSNYSSESIFNSEWPFNKHSHARAHIHTNKNFKIWEEWWYTIHCFALEIHVKLIFSLLESYSNSVNVSQLISPILMLILLERHPKEFIRIQWCDHIDLHSLDKKGWLVFKMIYGDW